MQCTLLPSFVPTHDSPYRSDIIQLIGLHIPFAAEGRISPVQDQPPDALVKDNSVDETHLQEYVTQQEKDKQ